MKTRDGTEYETGTWTPEPYDMQKLTYEQLKDVCEKLAEACTKKRDDVFLNGWQPDK